jgi:type IV pilus assembly protein PilV
MAMMQQQKHELAVGRPDAGFGLISVMVAIVLLSIGVMSVSQVLTQSVAMQTIVAMRTTGLDIARSYMEEVKGRDPLTLVSETEVRVNERGEADSSGDFTRELMVASVSLHLDEVTVIVTLPRSNPIRLLTWVYDGVY